MLLISAMDQCATFSQFVCYGQVWKCCIPRFQFLIGTLMSSYPTTSHSPSGHSRPWTGQSRPPTGRPQTSASTVRREGSYVVAIVEGRGVSREVGIAAVDRDTGHVMLVQVRRICSTFLCRLTEYSTADRRLSNLCKIPTPTTSSQSVSCIGTRDFSVVV